MGEISVSKILDSLANISTQIVTSQESIAKIKNGLSGVSNNAEQLAKYDGEIKYINHITVDNNKLLSTVIWIISVPNNLQNASKNINARIKDSVEWLERLNTEINNSEEIALYIESQVNDLSKNLSTTDLVTAFSALSTNIAMDEYSVARKKFINISDKNMKYWTDKPLQFQWDSKTGAYLILQSGVAMGWTDRDSVINYMKELEKSVISTKCEERADESYNKDIAAGEDEKIDDTSSSLDTDIPTIEEDKNNTSSLIGGMKENSEKAMLDALETDGEYSLHDIAENSESFYIPEGCHLRTDILLQKDNFFNDITDKDISSILYDASKEVYIFSSPSGSEFSIPRNKLSCMSVAKNKGVYDKLNIINEIQEKLLFK